MIRPYDVPPGERFGAEVALDGRRLAITSGFRNPKTVHIYERRVGEWVPVQRIGASRAAGWMSALALRGRTLVMGSPGDRVVHVYKRKGGLFRKEVTLYPLAGATDSFGRSVAIAKPKRIVVASTPTAYIFEKRRPNSAWKANAWLTDHGRGMTVAADGDTVVVSGYPDNHAQVFRLERGDWISQGALLGRDSGSTDGFAATLAIDGERVVASALWQAGERGALYVFGPSSRGWKQQEKLRTSGLSHELGSSVAISGEVIVAGSWGSGAWVFE